MNPISPTQAFSKLLAWANDSPNVMVIYGGTSIVSGWGQFTEATTSRLTIRVTGTQTSLSGERPVTADVTFEQPEIVASSFSTVFEAPENLQGKMGVLFDEAIDIHLAGGATVVLYKPSSSPQS